MTVIAWDGKVVAADKQITYGDLKKASTKIYKRNNSIIALSGCAGTAYKIIEWFDNGEKPEEWPDKIQQTDDWAQLIVFRKNEVYWYDRQPYKIHCEQSFMAWGIGAEMAIGALACGASARQAVKITCEYCEGCGMGIDFFEIGEE